MTDPVPRTVEKRQGRPRDPAADEAIICAVFDVITEAGFAGFSVEAVANRAGVGKATIYRRWPTREELIMAAAERVMVRGELPDTGSLRGDLEAWLWDKYRTSHDSPGHRLLGQVVVEARVNPELGRLLRRFVGERRAVLDELVDRARERGEIGEIDAALLQDLASGALLHRSLFVGASIRRADVAEVVDAALRGVGVDLVGRSS